MEFACSLCNYQSVNKSNIERHIISKCKVAEIIEIPVDINCEFCNKEFATKPNLKRHLKTCKVKKQNIEEENEKLRKENEKLKEALAQKPTTTINNNTVNININLAPWNDPNLDEAEKYYLQAIKKAFMSIPYIIEKIHFNPEMPENQNICIKNYRTKVAKVFDGRKWTIMDEDKVIKQLIDDYERLLEDWAEGKPEKRMQYIERYKEIKERDGRLKVENDIKDEIKKLIYVNRDMIKIKN